jgi:hypothetical protein
VVRFWQSGEGEALSPDFWHFLGIVDRLAPDPQADSNPALGLGTGQESHPGFNLNRTMLDAKLLM